ncbi:MAG: thymidine phosphorylase [bacterium]
MDAYELIMKKRNGGQLTDDEISFIVREFTEGDLPDYQMSAWLMTVWFNGMNGRERAIFTEEMVQTGITLDYPLISESLVDKHSTGGVGDGTSMALVPLVASFGVKIPMMSGRGLGHTGGTLDKLESIPGFEVEFEQDEINEILQETGALIMGQTGEVAPADRKMYALRDVTATVDSVDLIAGSIMSKKIAEGMDALVLDVKTGAGAFMKEYEKSVELARAMVEIGSNLGKTMRALITDMNQPLGRAVGNALEMKQSIEILRGEGPKDLTELICRLAAEMLVMGDKAANPEAGYEKAKEAINSGQATGKLKEIIEVQSGDPRVLDDFSLFPSAQYEEEIEAPRDGYVGEINAFEVGMAAKALGAGRETMDSPLDYGAGVIIDKKVGTSVKKGETLARICYNNSDEEQAPPCEPDQARERLQEAFSIAGDKPNSVPLVYARMDGSGDLTELEIPR